MSKEIPRKSLDNQQFLELRKATEKITTFLNKRLQQHLAVMKPLMLPRKLLGTYIKSSSMEEVAGSDKSFAELQQEFAAIAQKPFGLPTKLQPPLLPIQIQLDPAPFQFPLSSVDGNDKTIDISAACTWVLSYHSDCSLVRLRKMLVGTEPKNADEMKQCILNHLAVVIFLNHFKPLTQLLEDLRYSVEIQKLDEFGGLPVVVLRAPIPTFLPPDDFIQQITQLSGIPAFQELIDLDKLSTMPDPLKESLLAL